VGGISREEKVSFQVAFGFIHALPVFTDVNDARDLILERGEEPLSENTQLIFICTRPAAHEAPFLRELTWTW
jgi:hypothetical protein